MITDATQPAQTALIQAGIANGTYAADDDSSEADRAALGNILEQVLPLSDFVSRVSLRYPDAMQPMFQALLNSSESNNSESSKAPPQSIDYKQQLHNALQGVESEADFHRVLRSFRQVQMATLATLNILQLQNIQTSMTLVSNLADAIIEQAYLWVYAQHCNKHGSPQNNQHLQIMAMGKLGGSELNFSSDIDLIFAYPKAGETQDTKRPIEHQKFFTKVAQKLIYALDHITEHGFCYRTDMRLRPMGDSGPLVIPYAAVESYYQEQGRAWERFAMQKMRIINVNRDTPKLYALIKPFVYRKYIDFTTIDAIREMKVLIEKEVLRRQLVDNIKLGKGGIREVEFFAQSLQLIHAGREPRCQQVSTLKALDALYQYQFISRTVSEELKANYLYLRQVEHYLQIFDDEQTQVLPRESQNQQRLSTLLGHDSYQQSLQAINACMENINKHFSSIVEDANHSNGDTNTAAPEDLSVYNDIWNLNLEQQEVTALLSDTLSEADSAVLLEHIQAFKQKLQNASVSERGMRSVNRLMPLLLSEIHIDNNQLNQNQIKGIFGILLTITGRITYIDLLLENPAVRERLNSLCRKSLWVAKEIARHPILLDELLHPVYLKPDQLSLSEWKLQCTEELKQYMLRIEPNDVEEVMEILRQFKHAYQLRIAAADISGTIAINQVSDKLTLLAEVILAEVVEQAWRQVTLKHGVPKGQSASNKGFGVAAYGKFGGIELSYGSDLDIVCLYDATHDGQTDDTGVRDPISHQEFYIKVVQKIIHYCITKTYHGILYEIDLRLRPSGNSGLLITHIDSFADYQTSTAWTWEHQALVRARVVNGTDDFTQAFKAIRKNTLCLPRDAAKLLTDVAEMREKMRDHLDSSNETQIDIKQCLGGIVDIEFMVQFWVLRFAADYPQLSDWSDNLRVLDICSDIHVIDSEKAEALKEHYLWMRHLAHRLQLSGRTLAEPSDKLQQTQSAVSEIYQNMFGKPAAPSQ